MRRRILSAAALLAFTAALGLTGCDEAKSSNTGVPDKPSIEKATKNGKGKLASDEAPMPPVR